MSCPNTFEQNYYYKKIINLQVLYSNKNRNKSWNYEKRTIN